MNIDSGKLAKIQEASGWLKQAQIYYRSLQYEIGDHCVVKARAALNDECFQRQPIPGMGREIPETVWVKNPLNGGKMLINGLDFNPQIHTPWEEPTATKQGKSK